MLYTTRTLSLAALVSVASALGAQVTLTAFPETEQLVAREAVGDATAPFEVAGTSAAAAELVARVSAGGAVVDEATASVAAGGSFALAIDIPVTRQAHTVELLADGQAVATAERVLGGDVYIVVGQSNAIANYAMATPDRDSFLRGFAANVEPYTWALMGLTAAGEWAGRAASVLSKRHDVPIAVFNFAVGARNVAFFREGATEPHPTDDTSVPIAEGSTLTNFEVARDNLARAGALGKVRAVWWAQGEGDGFEPRSADYAGQLSDLLDEYQRELGVERMYGIQTRYRACTHPFPYVMEDQRRLHNRRDDVDFIATTNVMQNADLCHYAYYVPGEQEFVGNRVLGTHLADVISLETYGEMPELGLAALSPDIDSARVTGPREITLYFDAPGAQMAVTGAPWDEFRAEGIGAEGVFASGGSVSGNRVVITFDEDVSDATGATYLSHTGLEPDFIHNSAGRGAFTFFDVPTIPGDGAPGNLPDLELTLASANETVVPGENVVVEVSLANAGRSTARDVEVLFPLPADASVGYVGSAIPAPTVGTFDPGTGVWTVPTLAPGREIAMTVTYFTQANTPPTLTLWAEVSAQAGVDEDSAPGNAIGAGVAAGRVNEDDEARLVIGDRASDCVLNVEPVTSGCDVPGGTWDFGLLAAGDAGAALDVSGLPGISAASVSLATEQRYAFDYGALRATGDTVFTVTAARDATCANVFTVVPPASCTGADPSTGLFSPAPPAPLLGIAPNPVSAGAPLRVDLPADAGAPVLAELFDATGRRVWSGQVRGAFELPTGGLAGVYVLRAGRAVARVMVR